MELSKKEVKNNLARKKVEFKRYKLFVDYNGYIIDRNTVFKVHDIFKKMGAESQGGYFTFDCYDDVIASLTQYIEDCIICRIKGVGKSSGINVKFEEIYDTKPTKLS